jgi:hypothetical protein
MQHPQPLPWSADMSLTTLFGARDSPRRGEFDIVHHMAADSKGHLYTAEIVNNRRASS